MTDLRQPERRRRGDRGRKTLNHLALHYRAGDSGLIVRLFTTIGLMVEDLGPARNGDRLFKAYVQSPREDGFFFVTTATKEQLELERALVAACEPDLAAYRASRRFDPETGFHIAIRYPSLEAVERAVQGLQAAVAEDLGLAGRVTILAMKARSGGAPEIAARMATSPVFGVAERETFDPELVQVFVQTDLVAGGLLALGQTFELDYAFTGQVAALVPVRVHPGLG